MSTPKRIVVLISGNGTNLQALIDASRTGGGVLPYEISLVVSNRASAFGLQRAANARIPTLTFPLKPYRDAGKSRVDYDIDLADRILSAFRSSVSPDAPSETLMPDLLVLAGFMHILSAEFIARFAPGSIINLHPALPGCFDGARAIERAHEAFLQGKIDKTGVMVHRVIPEVDRGEVVLVREIPLMEGDTVAALEERIHKVEHELIVEGAKVALGI
ncbi:hypothetical protein HK101_008201 [Irineochytrium annulatum]|nr:hypothetical protein HK101_008201 [Irineochytrium annulatum]